MQDKSYHRDYWISSAEADIDAMNAMLSAKQNHWALFIGHLVIEKSLKAIYAQNKDIIVPRIHDLSRLADMAGLDLSADLKEKLDIISTFNISARYPDYKERFFRACTNDYTNAQVTTIKEIHQWLLAYLQKD